MMKNPAQLFICLFILLISSGLVAQQEGYFQQHVSYDINVQLDDNAHCLRGNISITYTNYSPDTLSYIYMHLWPNGYKHQQTAFAQQLLNNDRLDFHFTKPVNRGGIDSLDFNIDGKPIEYKENFTTPDIAKLTLPQPLLPQQKITIKTPFRVKIPADFSRLAHVDQAYMMCQWYPKPAVYDRNGWHPMSYLDHGEYYSEFGSFDVKITLPENYVVAATGQLETQSEMDFLEKRIAACKGLDYNSLYDKEDTIPASSKTMKTIRYTADNVHDFAWFADKRYYVQKGEVKLASGKKVETYVMFNNYEADLWKKSLDYVNRAVRYYSDIVGEYPYHKVMAVQGIYKGCDMEYPMVTVIGKAGYGAALDNVITHEVGHNWFYGILGSNERDHPWMDEGWNTYLDSRYMSRYYGYDTQMEHQAYVYQAARKEDQAIESASQDISSTNYYVCAYGKPTIAFRYLQLYLGTAEMDRILKVYYQTWKFKHPQPKDLRAIFEKEAKKPVAWFFDNVINSTKQLDYALTGYKCCDKHDNAQITIKNKGKIEAPIPVSVFFDATNLLQDSISLIEQDEDDEEALSFPTQWVENLAVGKDTTISMPANAGNYNIDLTEEVPEANRNNNVIRDYGIFRKGEPAKVKLVADFFNPEKRRINICPLVGFNMYDGPMVGGAIYNLPVPRRKWDYVVMPMFSTFALAPAGMAELKHHSYIKRHRFSHGIAFKTFHKRLQRAIDGRSYQFAERYYKITPYLEFQLGKKKDISRERHTFGMSHSLILEERGNEKFIQNPTDTFYRFFGKDMTWRTTHRLRYHYQNEQVLTPLSIIGMLEYANYDDAGERAHYIKLAVEGNFRFMYSKLWGLDMRIFAGGFLMHTDRDYGSMPLRLIANNRNDYHYDDHIMGRREAGNALANQVSLREGAFKTAIEPITMAGASNIFIFAINLKSDIPIKLPFRTKYVKIKPYLDIGYHKTNNVVQAQSLPLGDEFMVYAGIMIDIWDGAGGIYFPLIGTKNLDRMVRSFSADQFFRRITFSFNLERLRIEKLAPEVIGF